jgi:integrase
VASISTDKNGSKRIHFVGTDGKRRAFRIGKVDHDYAEKFRYRVEDLLAAAITNAVPREDTARWAAGLHTKIQDKLAAAGLIEIEEEDSQKGTLELGSFMDAWIASRTDVKEASRTVYRRARKHLVGYFGEGCQLSAITEGHADEWRAHLKISLEENTTRKMTSVAKQVFNRAVRKRLLDTNPFSELPTAVRANDTRDHIVTHAEITALIEAAPDAEWRLIFALARYGGLRTPSETLLLKWSDIDWQKLRMTVTSPKTEHHEYGGFRVTPVFPELLPYLEDCFDKAEAGAVHVIERHRLPSGNLGPQTHRIMKRAGITAWPKLFMNMRSSRQTELEDKFPTHVVCKWLGNKPAVAHKHYLKVTEEHFADATRVAQNLAHRQAKSGARQEVTGDDTVTQVAAVTSTVATGNAASDQKERGSGDAAETPSSGRYWT